jgi:hypothetical protein
MSREIQAIKETFSPKVVRNEAFLIGETSNADKIDMLQLMADSSRPVMKLKTQSDRMNESAQSQNLTPLFPFSSEDSTKLKRRTVQSGSDASDTYQLVGYDITSESQSTDKEQRQKDGTQLFLTTNPLYHGGYRIFNQRLKKLMTELDPGNINDADQLAQKVWKEVYEVDKVQVEIDKIPYSPDKRIDM